MYNQSLDQLIDALLEGDQAAIGVAINVLLAEAGIGYDELRRVCIAGVFGQHLDLFNARDIGLLPAVPEQFMEAAGNTALSGCEALLLSSAAEERLCEARNRASMINLSDCTDFNELFLEHLFLRPVTGL